MCSDVAGPEEQKAQWKVPAHAELKKECGFGARPPALATGWGAWNGLSVAAKRTPAFRLTPCVVLFSVLAFFTQDEL